MGRSRQAALADLGVAMQRYQRTVQSFDDAVGRILGLGPADLRCLDVLTEGARSAGELATATGLRPAATTALIDRLAERGFVRRVPDAADRRRVLVEMTDEGYRRTGALYGPMIEEAGRPLEGFTVTEIERMRALLDGFTEVTERHARGLAQG
ncbi:MarR family winged helix-turn-helix transcriptional regulator [Oryzobacter telluris]|uniref:MarR family winged helix-turn-helix transcriptional regulator n=1 Tax=Oryzobacter telluris TaxID=3149179 RepID=UPI00370DD5EE